MEILSTETQRSENNLDLDFVIVFDRSVDQQKESSIFEIGHFVLVRFRFVYGNDLMKSSVLYQIHDSQTDPNVQITATCTVDKKVTRSVCSYDWLGYMDFCVHNQFKYMADDIWVCHIILNISVTLESPCRRNNMVHFLCGDDNFTDFHLGTEDGISSIPVHRAIMAAHSEVFKTMLNGQWKETAKGCLEVKGVTQQTLQHLKDYMYLGSLPEHEDLRPLLLIAKCYMMHRLEEACTDKLARTVKPESLLDLVNFAMDNHLSELIFSIIDVTPLKVVSTAREAKNQKPKLAEV